MTSTRLPEKVLMEVMGRPLLSYQLERARLCRSIDEVIVATTINVEDDGVAALAELEGVSCYRGKEHDVADRYYQAAKLFSVDHIVRLTADCPLIEPAVCDLVTQTYLESDADYVRTGRTYAEGLDCEAFSFEALEDCWMHARLVSEREYPTLYILAHPDKYKEVTLENSTDDSCYRITVDEESDFLLVQKVFEALYPKFGAAITMQQVKSFLQTNPDVYELNAHIMRNEGLKISLEKDGVADGVGE